MFGWGLGDRPDLLPHNEDDEMDNEKGAVDHWDLGRKFRGWCCPLSSSRRMVPFSSSPSLSPAKRWRSRVRRKLTICQESNGDEEEFTMVVKRMASALGVEADSQELSGAMDPGNSAK